MAVGRRQRRQNIKDFGPVGRNGDYLVPFEHKAPFERMRDGRVVLPPLTSVADPDPSDPYVFGPPGSGSISQRYGSGSGSFYHQAKIVRKALIPTVL